MFVLRALVFVLVIYAVMSYLDERSDRANVENRCPARAPLPHCESKTK